MDKGFNTILSTQSPQMSLFLAEKIKLASTVSFRELSEIAQVKCTAKDWSNT